MRPAITVCGLEFLPTLDGNRYQHHGPGYILTLLQIDVCGPSWRAIVRVPSDNGTDSTAVEAIGATAHGAITALALDLVGAPASISASKPLNAFIESTQSACTETPNAEGDGWVCEVAP